MGAIIAGVLAGCGDEHHPLTLVKRFNSHPVLVVLEPKMVLIHEPGTEYPQVGNQDRPVFAADSTSGHGCDEGFAELGAGKVRERVSVVAAFWGFE